MGGVNGNSCKPKGLLPALLGSFSGLSALIARIKPRKTVPGTGTISTIHPFQVKFWWFGNTPQTSLSVWYSFSIPNPNLNGG
jgi:hypothetical protein